MLRSFGVSWTANAFYAQGPPFAALTTTFTVPLFLGYPAYQTSLPTDTFSNWYCVRVTARDRSHWVSSAVYIKTIYAVDPPLTTVTPPPDLQEIHEDPSVYQSGGRMLFWQWCAPSPDVSLYLTYLRIGEDGPVSVDTTMLSGHAYHLSGYTYNYLPLTDYALWMVAANAYGLSPVSDTLRITTREPALPFNQQAHVIYPSGCVKISYSLERLCDSVLIQRRDPATAWTTIATISGNSGTGGATDAAPAPGHDYYYRVGAEFSNGIWWSTDSLHVERRLSGTSPNLQEIRDAPCPFSRRRGPASAGRLRLGR